MKQRTLFRQRLPEMPEGYYSSGPNPNLRRFVEEHATPYDPETDDYDVPPFDKPITDTKATAIYNMHTYWSKKPHDAIRQYIRHYTKPGDIVLDPFCGSGSTALAALMEGRAAIAIDLSPAATFITKNYCTPVDVEELQRAFEDLERRVKPELDWLYETRCDRCEGRATTAYTVYSQVFQCPRCLEKVPLFDCVETEGLTTTGKPKKIRACPHCYQRGQVEEISTRGEKFGAVPVLVSYLCQEGCRPQRGGRRHNDPDPKKRRFFQEYDLGKLAEIEGREIPHWYPDADLAEKIPYRMLYKKDFRPTDARRLPDLFTKRNLWALAAIRAGILATKDERMRDVALFGFNAVLLGMSRMNRHRPEVSYPTNIMNGTYYIPQVGQEEPPLKHALNKLRRLQAGYHEVNQAIASMSLLVSTQSATSLPAVPDSSVDYLFTDPPYAGKVQYGELNFVWEAWLGFNTEWHDGEITVNSVRGKTEEDWAEDMRRAMGECYRVLKPGRWLSLCYHDTSEGTWQLVQDIMAEVGFISEQTDRVLYIDTGQKSYNQLTAEKVTKRDAVINFRKPRPGELAADERITGEEDEATFNEKVRAILRTALEDKPGQTADRLYDEVVSRMVRRGEFRRHNFDELLRSVAEPVSEPRMKNLFEPESPNLFGTHETVRWYLLDTADQADEAESAKEGAAAARLEGLIRRYLEEKPEEGGVHYSDLFEAYLPVRDKPRRLLADFLPEFFLKTNEGTWRLPATDEEREQLTSLRQSGALRRIRRFARALIEGVPPAPRDRPENVATAADWLQLCRRAGLYDLGRALYEKGGFDFSTLGEEGALEVEEDYRLCVRRSGIPQRRKER